MQTGWVGTEAVALLCCAVECWPVLLPCTACCVPFACCRAQIPCGTCAHLLPVLALSCGRHLPCWWSSPGQHRAAACWVQAAARGLLAACTLRHLAGSVARGQVTKRGAATATLVTTALLVFSLGLPGGWVLWAGAPLHRMGQANLCGALLRHSDPHHVWQPSVHGQWLCWVFGRS